MEPLVVGRSEPHRKRPPFGYTCAAIAVRTRLVCAHDDLPALVAQAVSRIAHPDDVIAVSETALAIAQNRIIAAETIRPSRLAYALSRRAGALATVHQPESLQLVIDDAGPLRVIVAAAAQLLGRLMGVRGLFYRVLGPAIAAIDGYTGTLPPFERTIVLGPVEPDVAAAAIAARCGAAAVVVDANDLGVVTVLGASAGVDCARVAAALRSNPHGNGDEQTPIVVLAWRGPQRSPLLARAA
ncbi:MAG: coenzyme F420-0:L-glutamate ligase [Candidatus Eremiobacteraeota bacterium]|nr:coenzyme F420-0:L-glutamate ligase [Candidatus Eremiobacteraeota bacterium]